MYESGRKEKKTKNVNLHIGSPTHLAYHAASEDSQETEDVGKKFKSFFEQLLRCACSS